MPTCPKCGAELPADAPAGLCPQCLVQAGFESEKPPQPGYAPTATSPAPSGFQPPAVEELARRFPQLEILELLGKGGMGAVYKARQPGLDRLVAVKILPAEISGDPTFAERFNREARALAKLNHPRIVAIYDFGQSDGLYFFVMEYVDGVNLRQAIQAGGMTPASALAIVPQICEALQFAHDEGIVHRDIKPENILIDKRGRVKIADFGLAKLLGQEQADRQLTATHQVMGTLRYMAPEQMFGLHEVDHRADIYSLGVVFYELLTGELPIGQFAPPSKKVEIDVRLDEIVLRALESKPEQRYQQASELKTSVDHITATGDAAANRALPIRQTNPPRTAPAARLSRCALTGAIWASYFFAALLVTIPLYLSIVSLSWSRPTMNLPTIDVRSERTVKLGARKAGIAQIADANGASMLHGLIAQAVAAPSDSRELLRLLLMFAAAVAGLIAIAGPFGTTILGCVAIGQIHRSAGKLYGLPLAVFDTLLFPLLLLDLLLLAVSYGLSYATWDAFVRDSALSRDAQQQFAILLLLFFFASFGAIAVWLDLRIVRTVWRKVMAFEPPPPFVEARLSGRDASFERRVEASRKEPEPQRQFAGESKTNVEEVVVATDDAANRAPPIRQTNLAPTAPNARLSRCALTGAIWASYFFAALLVAIPFGFFWSTSLLSDRKAENVPTINARSEKTVRINAQKAAIAQIADANETSMLHGLIADVAIAPGGTNWLFTYLMILAAAVAGLIAIAAPFGTTILGCVAIGHIRRSAGKLYGLPLAAFDALLFPLLLLDGIILVVVAAAIMLLLVILLSLLGDPNHPQAALAAVLPAALTLGIGLPLIAWVDYRVVRSVWRKVIGFEPLRKPAVAATPDGADTKR